MDGTETPGEDTIGARSGADKDRALAEYASLRDEALRANDQSLALQGFTLASVALVVGAAVGANISAGTRVVLFSGLQIVVLLIVIQVGARRRQHATIVSYLAVFHGDDGHSWEPRLQVRRNREGPLAVDRWYGWGEAAFIVFIALVGLVGSAWALSLTDDLSPVAVVLAVVVNVVGISATLVQAIRKKYIQDLMTTEIEGWKAAARTEIE
ncbi:MAG: hypothetical protein WBP59_10670 [Ilumatobacteraceae bacterium]